MDKARRLHGRTDSSLVYTMEGMGDVKLHVASIRMAATLWRNSRGGGGVCVCTRRPVHTTGDICAD